MCEVRPRDAHAPDSGDVWGAILRDTLAGRRAAETVERDDGFILAYDAAYFLAPYEEWDDPVEREAMTFVRGRVLDIGCGGGRVALYLQEYGHEVVAIDSSPGAVQICLERGVKDARVLDIEAVSAPGARPAAPRRLGAVRRSDRRLGSCGCEPRRAPRMPCCCATSRTASHGRSKHRSPRTAAERCGGAPTCRCGTRSSATGGF
jgi:hypothetical protein